MVSGLFSKMSSNNETGKAVSQKARRKQRLLNEGDKLEEYVLKLNGPNPPSYVTKDVDLTKCKKNPVFVTEYMYKPFKIKQLIKNGIDTHYGSCDICNILKGKEHFFQIGQSDCNVKASVLSTHAFRNHGRKAGLPIQRKRKADPDTQPAKKLRMCTPTQKALDDIDDQNLRLLASGQVKALGIFADPEFVRRDELVLQAHGVDPSGAQLISKSRPTTRRRIFDKTEARRKTIQEQLPVIAEKFGGVGWSFDHKVCLNSKSSNFQIIFSRLQKQIIILFSEHQTTSNNIRI